MEFRENSAIYLQIAELIFDWILSEKWKPEERIPAVRELSVNLEVNPNTVMRTYQLLESMNIICLKRGTGFYLTENAYEIVYSSQKETFLKTELPEMFRKLQLLKIKPDELQEIYNHYLLHE